MDVLSQVLAVSGVRGSAGACLDAAGPWGFGRPGVAGEATVYALTSGSALLTVAGRTVVRLRPGDVALLPTGATHTMAGSAGAPTPVCDGAAVRVAREAGVPVAAGGGGGGAVTRLVGVSYVHDAPLLAMLPAVLHVPAERAGPLGGMVGAVEREFADPGAPASSFVLDRLVDLLQAHVLRGWITGTPIIDAAWWAVLRDPQLSAVVASIHDRPDLPWTAAGLAEVAAMSKSTLHRRFLAATGMNPVGYLTRWRMSVAANRLRDLDEPVERVARAVGYTSVFAFTRAFHRERGMPPSRFRRFSREPRPAAPA
ncbi:MULTISPECIES: AraC family transcriptional regulator [Catenuloplanes]|uniref:AraC-like DNA-binding protein n=1 Tax=Catenuloplanes niger TaxID=587534 RepID=A0AAE3ZMU0_9ACTN|nr:AraC family transcriptional regulator [Catenuloplanes niger]MDR7320745.1 AraC-like DNA-binding protein [Catenuloplanes niger]